MGRPFARTLAGEKLKFLPLDIMQGGRGCRRSVWNGRAPMAQERTMRYLKSAIALTAMVFLAGATAAAADAVTYVSKDKVAAAMAKGGPLASGSDYIVSVSRRDKGGSSEVHDNETDTFYIMEGAATFVTGGTMVDAKTSGPGQSRGSGITGGTSHALSKGDVITIPKGTPHWFKEVPKLVVYYVVKSKH
jgi:quercetin dioxygenase-like cupin family protein